MSDPYLLLSTPPHPEADVATIAQQFGVSTAEAGMRLNYRSAAIWFADVDLAMLQKTARALQSAGARVRLIAGKSLPALDNRLRLRKFSFQDDHLSCIVEGNRPLTVPYTWSASVIVCKPMQTETIVRRTLRQTAKFANRNKSIRQDAKTKIGEIKGHEDHAFVDVYFHDLPHVHRLTIRPGDTDFSGLGPQMKPVVNENISVLVEVLRARFDHVIEDRRLENLPAPKPALITGQPIEGVLESLQPGLGRVDPYDLLSRLSFLSAARRREAA